MEIVVYAGRHLFRWDRSIAFLRFSLATNPWQFLYYILLFLTPMFVISGYLAYRLAKDIERNEKTKRAKTQQKVNLAKVRRHAKNEWMNGALLFFAYVFRNKRGKKYLFDFRWLMKTPKWNTMLSWRSRSEVGAMLVCQMDVARHVYQPVGVRRVYPSVLATLVDAWKQDEGMHDDTHRSYPRTLHRSFPSPDPVVHWNQHLYTREELKTMEMFLFLFLG